jgi:hypothetical protein
LIKTKEMIMSDIVCQEWTEEETAFVEVNCLRYVGHGFEFAAANEAKNSIVPCLFEQWVGDGVISGKDVGDDQFDCAARNLTDRVYVNKIDFSNEIFYHIKELFPNIKTIAKQYPRSKGVYILLPCATGRPDTWVAIQIDPWPWDDSTEIVYYFE